MNSMKKINAYMQLLLLSVVLLSISCTGDFENMNRNPNEVTDGQMDALNYKIGHENSSRCRDSWFPCRSICTSSTKACRAVRSAAISERR